MLDIMAGMNKEKLREILERRRSNAAVPIPSKRKYSRNRKHRNRDIGD